MIKEDRDRELKEDDLKASMGYVDDADEEDEED